MSDPKPTIIIHDGATDELMSILFAASMPQVNLQGIMVLNADCLGYPTARVSSKLLDLIHLEHVPVAVSGARGWNAFPWTYRQYALMVDLLPIVNQFQPDVEVPKPAMDLPLVDMVDRVYQANDKTPVTLLCLSPVTDIAQALRTDPDFKKKVAEIVWMGGVYITAETPFGNIDTGIAPGANPNAEWNVYWDPQSAQEVLRSGIDVKVFPLNVTNKVTLNGEIIRKYFLPDSGQYPAVSLAAQMYCLVAFQTGFSFWDTAATAYLGNADLFDFKAANVTVDLSPEPDKQGTMSVDFLSPDEAPESPVKIATHMKVKRFYDYYLQQLKTLEFKGSPR